MVFNADLARLALVRVIGRQAVTIDNHNLRHKIHHL